MRSFSRWLAIFLFQLILHAGFTWAQPGTGIVRGQVSDQSGAVIPGVKITATSSDGSVKATTSGPDGTYTITGLAPGAYSVRAAMAGLTQSQPAVANVSAGSSKTLDIQLRVALEKQEVTVQDTAAPTVSVDPQNNAGALILRGDDLKALSDDPDDLASDLQALAGPSAGPNGGQIYIDGFTGGRLPPKESIREVRINQNPFSSEYDRLGYGRIEIFTKPGSDKFRGQTFFNISDNAFNSRNPYLISGQNPPFQSRQYGGTFSGPLSKKASFFLDFERREIDDDSIVNARIVDPSFAIVPFSQALATPQRRTTFSPRVDYQLGSKVTLMARYTFTRNDIQDSGAGNFTLPSQAFNTFNTEQTLQLTETAVLNPKTINETRFQYIHDNNLQNALNNAPSVDVISAFNGGGSTIGRTSDLENHYELQNYTSIANGAHTWRFGARVRAITVDNASPQNFAGTFIFGGGLAPELDAANQPILDASGNYVLMPITSIERYRRTLLFQSEGLPSSMIRTLGGGATQFSIAAGNPFASVNQVDLGLFAQDDWKLRPNFTLSLGLRYETQTNIHDWRDIAPRVGFAWAPGQKIGSARASTVIRGGVGMFYDRFDDTYTLDAERFNGIAQQQFFTANPEYPNIPALGTLSGAISKVTRVDSTLRAPYVIQSAIGVERHLPRNTTLAVNFTNSRGVHLLRSRDINAPLPGSGLRPYGDVGEIDVFESTGILNQNQIITNLTSRLNSNFTMFASYAYNNAKSDTDGALSLPANQYDLRGEYGRAAIDIHHRAFLGGSINTKWNVRFSPFIIVRSGAPYNITVGRDIFGDTLFNGRPALVTDASKPGVVVTRLGIFDPNPGPGEIVIPRNYGDGPGFFTVNLRVAKTFGFGAAREGGRQASGSDNHGGRGGGGGMRMGGGGFHSLFSDPPTSKRYNLTLSVQARNLFNHVNQGAIVGDITSPIFGQSNQLAGGFGATPANNRRIELQLRFSF